jgi:hypothetical protein
MKQSGHRPWRTLSTTTLLTIIPQVCVSAEARRDVAAKVTPEAITGSFRNAEPTVSGARPFT